MILTGDEIKTQVERGRITIDPYVEAHTGPNSHDLTLHDVLLTYDSPASGRLLGPAPWDEPLDCKRDNPTREDRIPAGGLVLWPGRLYLGCTRESVGSREYLPWVDGRSGAARLGLGVHVAAGRADLGFLGRLTLELTVVHPLRVYAGMRLCQVSFLETVGLRTRLYAGKYSGADGPRPSALWRDWQDGKDA